MLRQNRKSNIFSNLSNILLILSYPLLLLYIFLERGFIITLKKLFTVFSFKGLCAQNFFMHKLLRKFLNSKIKKSIKLTSSGDKFSLFNLSIIE